MPLEELAELTCVARCQNNCYLRWLLIRERLKRNLWDAINILLGFPGGSVLKNPPANAGEAVSIPGSERSPGEGNANPLQYSCLENPMDRGAWLAIVYGVTKESDTI